MIQLTKNLWLKADDCCYIVGQLRQRANKGDVLRNPTYHTTAAQAVEGALKRAMRQGVAEGSITTLQQFIQEQERLRAELEALISPLDGGQACHRRVEAHQAAAKDNYISQSLDGEKEAHT